MVVKSRISYLLVSASLLALSMCGGSKGNGNVPSSPIQFTVTGNGSQGQPITLTATDTSHSGTTLNYSISSASSLVKDSACISDSNAANATSNLFYSTTDPNKTLDQTSGAPVEVTSAMDQTVVVTVTDPVSNESNSIDLSFGNAGTFIHVSPAPGLTANVSQPITLSVTDSRGGATFTFTCIDLPASALSPTISPDAPEGSPSATITATTAGTYTIWIEEANGPEVGSPTEVTLTFK